MSTYGEAGAVKLGRQRSPEHHRGPHMRPYLRVANVYLNRIDLRDVKQMNFAPAEFDIYRLQAGDILFNEGQSAELVGRPARFCDEIESCCFQNTLVRMRPHPFVDSRFALIVAMAHFLSGRFRQIARHTTNISHLGSDRLAGVEFPVPPLAEQSRIADRVDELFTDLAAGVAALERVKRNLSRYRAAVLHAAVTGRLTEAWRKQHGPATEPGAKLLERILVERRRQWEERTRAKYERAGKQPPKNWRERYPDPSPPKPPADGSSLPALPKGWCWATNDQLASTITSGSRDWSPYYDRGSGTFIMAGNVRMGWLDRSYRQAVDPPPNHRDRLRSQVEEHDLLVTIVGANTGDVCRVAEPLPEHYICQSVSLMRPVLGETSMWMLTWFTAPTGAQRQFKEFIYGAGRPHLGFEHLEQTLVALPPLAEQSAIVEAVNETLSQIDGLEAGVNHGLARASRLRQAILKAAFDGRLVPQDPSDEPASSLLERIRTDAAGTASKPNPKSRPRKTTSRKAATP